MSEDKGILEQAKDKMAEGVEAVKDTAGNLKDKIVGEKSTEQKAADHVKDGADKTADKISDLKDKAHEKKEDAKDKIDELKKDAGNKLQDKGHDIKHS
ncbi:LEA2 protein [Aphelenchoides besseyi]|nr:LEA2 protein [Aphelenchoides besseyi]KAI6199042.1 LEA2 protein [Aphelenchoides besseyi]